MLQTPKTNRLQIKGKTCDSELFAGKTGYFNTKFLYLNTFIP